VGHFRFLEKWAVLPLLSGAFVSLCSRKLALARAQTANLSAQSPVAKFQYPNLFDGDSVRECGDRFEISGLADVQLPRARQPKLLEKEARGRP
jgi:hypothetical protein